MPEFDRFHTRGRLGGALAAAILLASAAGLPIAQAQPEWSASLEAATAAAGPLARRDVIGRSAEGRELIAVRLSKALESRRPTVLVIAGLDARHRPGPLIAAGVLERVAREHASALDHADLLVVACLNPDGVHRFATERPRTDRRGNAAVRASARDDADRDRRVDEDGPVDVNGDGVITQMRVRRPAPGLMRGLVATDIADPDDPRLLRRADAGKGEVAEFAVLAEGTDQDGDGLIAEDAAEGVDLNANFPYHWPEFAGHSGPTPLSEPETLALARWALDRPEIVAVLEYGPNDNLLNPPTSGKMDATGEAPISGGILDDDKPVFERVSESYRATTGITGVGGIAASFDGSLQGWAYAQLGIAAFVTPGCVRPDLIKPPPDDKPAAEASADKPADEKPAAKDDKTKVSEEVKWLRHSDAQIKAGDAAGYVEWKPFTHPQLGPVEIGGWMPGFKLDATQAQIDAAVPVQARAVAELLAMLPRLEPSPPRVQPLGDGVWRVTVSARNTGKMPTRLAMGVRARRHADTRWEMDLAADRIISGAARQGVASIAAGGEVTGSWVVRGAAGSTMTARLISPECGEQSVSITLEAASVDGKEGSR